MQVPDIIIAIDGYSSTGKSSFAKIVANEFSFTYLDSGALYRAVTLFAMENGFIDDECTIDVPGLEKALTDLDVHFGKGGTYIGERCVEKEIRSLAIAGKVSPIATVPQVRNFVDKKLREFGKLRRIVMDGRDIGTAVFPHAEMKVFVDASPEVRARRRYNELKEKGMPADYDEVFRNINERDHIDRTRAVSPLRKADDAHLLCNDNMSLDEQLDYLTDLYHKTLANLPQ